MSLSRILQTIFTSLVLTIVVTTGALATKVTANQTVNVRANASTSSQIVSVMEKGATRTVLNRSGRWVKVKVKGETGYVHTNNLTTRVDSYQAKTSASCALRALPSADSDRLRSVPSGKSVTVLGTSGGWYMVELGSRTGFIAKSKIKDPFYTKVCNKARDLLGSRYVYGATGPDSFDCSGFTQYVYRSCGKSIPRTSSSQYASSTKVSRSHLKAGQLVFFSGSGGGSSVGHVGIYIGDNKMIHAANSSTGVIVSSLSESYYASHYIGAGRY